jgi:hypothetical protein
MCSGKKRSHKSRVRSNQRARSQEGEAKNKVKKIKKNKKK